MYCNVMKLTDIVRHSNVFEIVINIIVVFVFCN